jgi:hypothetical protein
VELQSARADFALARAALVEAESRVLAADLAHARIETKLIVSGRCGEKKKKNGERLMSGGRETHRMWPLISISCVPFLLVHSCSLF